MLERRWLVVVLALALTGLGAAITGLLFTSGINLLRDWRLDLLDEFPAWVVLPALGAIGGMVSAWLITNLSPAAGGAGITHIMGFLRHRSVPMGLRVGLVKLVAGIIAIGSGFPLGPEGPAVQMGGSVAWQMSRWLRAPVAFRRVRECFGCCGLAFSAARRRWRCLRCLQCSSCSRSPRRFEGAQWNRAHHQTRCLFHCSFFYSRSRLCTRRFLRFR